MAYYITNGTSACPCTASITWTGWCTNATTASSTSATNVWTLWNTTIRTTSYGYDPWSSWTNAATYSTRVVQQRVQAAPYRPPIETPEQIAAREQREREYRARLDRERAERLEAERKAEVLLLRHLSAAQREEYLRTGAFTVAMADGRSYRIKKGWSGNVEHFEAPKLQPVLERDGGLIASAANGAPRQIERLCIHPIMTVPNCDNMLAQKLLLESDEREFRRIANITRTG